MTQTSMESSVRRQLAAADRNGDGSLTVDELRSLAMRQGPAVDLVDRARWFRTDFDGDGRIAVEDISALYIAAFEDLDRDGDGALTSDELRASQSEQLSFACAARREVCDAERKNAAVAAARRDGGRLFDRLDWWARRYYRYDSGIERPFYGAVRDYRAWHALWDQIVSRHGPQPVNPSIDFSKSMLLVAATGTKPTGGHGVQIVSVKDAGTELVATAVRTSPGRRCGATAALTHPADIVRVPASAKPVRWVLKDRASDCP